MLVRFRVGNFMSFDSVQEFSMIGGKVRNKNYHVENDGSIKLLKFGALFGANASGKSNLVKAMNYAKSVVLDGINSGFSNYYFRLNDSNAIKPSYFEFEIKIEGKYYAYGFEIILSKNEIVSEWLYELSPYSNTVIFERNIKNSTFTTNLKLSNKDLKKRMDVYSNDIRSASTVLFLNEINRNKDEIYKEKNELYIFKQIYMWIKNNLDINYPEMPISDYSHFYNEFDVDEVSNLISAFGTGITSYKIVATTFDEMAKSFPKSLIDTIERDINKKVLENNNSDDKEKSSKILKSITIRINDNIFIININSSVKPEVKTIVFEHGSEGTFFKFSEESDGTKRLFDLLEILLSDDNEKVYVIDEIDRSLHPQLTYKFVETFLNLSSKRKTQLIVTTHESRLLDFNLLRRDEIWFIDKGKNGDSSIFSLDAYNDRFDKKIDKAYLEGRYGGVPIFSTVFPVKGEG